MEIDRDTVMEIVKNSIYHCCPAYISRLAERLFEGMDEVNGIKTMFHSYDNQIEQLARDNHRLRAQVEDLQKEREHLLHVNHSYELLSQGYEEGGHHLPPGKYLVQFCCPSKKIQVIKLVREMFSVGLKEAKESVNEGVPLVVFLKNPGDICQKFITTSYAVGVGPQADMYLKLMPAQQNWEMTQVAKQVL